MATTIQWMQMMEDNKETETEEENKNPRIVISFGTRTRDKLCVCEKELVHHSFVSGFGCCSSQFWSQSPCYIFKRGRNYETVFQTPRALQSVSLSRHHRHGGADDSGWLVVACVVASTQAGLLARRTM